jgi:hypothetical protein
MVIRPAAVALAFLAFAAVADARADRPELAETLAATVREHQRTLEAEVPRRENDLRAATASLDRSTSLYARGLIGRDELSAAAREAGQARARLTTARLDLARTATLLVELEGRRRLARLPSLRPGQYDASDAFVRYAGTRSFSMSAMRALERYFAERIGRPLPISAVGQTSVHVRLGLDHRDAVDLALHPDTVEGRLVIGWLRAQDISFLAFRAAQTGMATGAHIHVGAPSERLTSHTRAAMPRAPAAPARDDTRGAVESDATAASGASGDEARSIRR